MAKHIVTAIILLISGSQLDAATIVACRSGGRVEDNATNKSRPLNLQFNLVRAVSRELRNRGYSVELDGIYSDEIRTAVRNVQRGAGLQATGDIDCETVMYLLNADISSRWRESEPR